MKRKVKVWVYRVKKLEPKFFNHGAIFNEKKWLQADNA
jgi:hypothetical protein